MSGRMGPRHAPNEAPRSQAFLAYRAIRADVLAAHLPAGRKLRIAELAAVLSVNPGAVREALSRLVSEQFVVSRDQRGFNVAPCTATDLEDLADLRCEVDAMALRRSVERGGIDWEAGLVSASHRLRSFEPMATFDRSSASAAIEALRHFQGALVSGCGSPRLISLSRHLADHWERYRAMAANPAAWLVRFDAVRPIVDHALAREADRLVAIFVSEIRTTASLCLMPVADRRRTEAAGGYGADG